MRNIFFWIILCLAGCDSNLTGVPFIGAPDYDLEKSMYLRAKQDDLQAIIDLQTMAEEGNTPAAFYFALLNDPGVALLGDADIALKFYELAAKHYTGAMHNEGLILLKLNNAEANAKAIKLLEMSATKGRKESMLLAAELLENGSDGISRNKAKAIDFYELAATTYKDPISEYKIGIAYMNGEGRELSKEKAILYLTAAAKSGVVEAQYQLFILSEPKNVAAQWLVIAAKHDEKYIDEANIFLKNFNKQQIISIIKNANLWAHAHEEPTEDIIVNIFTPVGEP